MHLLDLFWLTVCMMMGYCLGFFHPEIKSYLQRRKR